METVRHNPDLAAVILAAGKGTRMNSDLPKVLHTLGGRPLLAWCLEAVRALGPGRIVVVVGHQAERVRRAFAGQGDLTFALQEPQLGTGHAVMAAAPELAAWQGPVLILCGDVPGLRPATLQALLDHHRRRGEALTVLGMEPPDPGHYGRLITSPDGMLERIVEYRDATPEQRRLRLVNAGVYVAQAQPLLATLPQLRRDNDQGEYYLTDLVELMRRQGLAVGYTVCQDPAEVAGVNRPEELAALERRLGRGAG
jgi:UDP-N-acetylglucosamine diphosphorylase/glucosamine-1-phosphate N-acetyltransferase